MFCCTLLYVHSSIANILMGKRDLIALLHLSSWCLVMVERLFLTVPRGCMQFVIVVFPDHTYLLFLHLSISNDIVSTKIYDKHDNFDFKFVNFPFLDGDVPRSISYGVYICQLIRFARASSYITDFNTRNKLFTQNFLNKAIGIINFANFSKFYRGYYDLISKFQVGLKSHLRHGLSEPEFYGDLVYKLKKIVGSNNFSRSSLKLHSL